MVRVKVKNKNNEAGAVSIFLVVFFALLLGVITIGFINIVIRDSRQAVNSDLSQSAFDSAQAGIEDSKRALALYGQACATGSTQCEGYRSRLNANTCDTLASDTFRQPLNLRLSPKTDEQNKAIAVQNTDNDTLDQAYTCVKVQLNTPDYIGSKPAYSSDIIPLTATAPFDSVNVDWFTHADAGLKDTDNFTLPGGARDLPPAASWPTTTPSVLRVELISYGATFSNETLSDDMRTLFLYPANSGTKDTTFDLDALHRTSDKAAPIAQTACTASGERYACSTKISLGNLGTSAGKSMMLRVTPIYGAKTTFRLSLGSTGGTDPLFEGVQPSVDSTGRAGDLFRRVEARLRTGTTVLYPEYALDVDNSICKNFSVGATDGDYIPGTCN